MTDWTPVKERLTAVKARLNRADQENGSLTELLAVSKTFPPEAVLAAAEMGQRAFGENYAQEGCDKIEWFRTNHPELPLVWHFIGPLQSNKTKIVAEHFDWVESIDRVKIAQVAAMPNLRLRGLMAIPAPADTREGKLVPLTAMRALYDRYAETYGFDVLSMGMSADMEEAVEAGATQVRVGSAIFGARHYPAKPAA